MGWVIKVKELHTLKDLLYAAPVLAYPAPGEKIILDSYYRIWY